MSQNFDDEFNRFINQVQSLIEAVLSLDLNQQAQPMPVAREVNTSLAESNTQRYRRYQSILILEKSELGRVLWSHALERVANQVHFFKSIEDALRSIESGTRFDLILIDLEAVEPFSLPPHQNWVGFSRETLSNELKSKWVAQGLKQLISEGKRPSQWVKDLLK